MSKNTKGPKISFINKSNGITELRFNERIPETGKLAIAYVLEHQVIGFGYFSEEEFTKNGDFKSWRKIGYIETKLRRYITSKYIVNDILIRLKNRIIDVSLQRLNKTKKSGIIVNTMNKDYKLCTT